MDKFTEKEIKIVEEWMGEEMNQVLALPDTDERTNRGQVLFRMYQIFKNYDELEPVLNKFFEEKHYKEKSGSDKEK